MQGGFPRSTGVKRRASGRDHRAPHVGRRGGCFEEPCEVGVGLQQHELETTHVVLLRDLGRCGLRALRLEPVRTAAMLACGSSSSSSRWERLGPYPDGVREHAHGPEAQEDDQRRDDAEAVVTRADRHAHRGDHPQGRRRRQALDVDAVLDDRPRAEEPDAGDHVRDDPRRVEHDAGAVAELHLRPREVADDDEERRAEPDEHVRPQACLLVAELALEADGACEHDDDEHSHDAFPERQVRPHARPFRLEARWGRGRPSPRSFHSERPIKQAAAGRRPVIVRPMTGLQRRLAVARGDAPADLVVRGGRVLSVFTREWLEADVAIVDGVIAGIGSYDGEETIDAAGRFVVPGFIDAHMHLESVKLLVDEFARLVLPLGTTAVVADPHEIANVLGSDGVHWLHDASAGLQLEVFFMAPSCVPASAFESPRRPLAPGDLEALMRRNRVLGLAEMMNFPGVIAGDPGELEKLALDGAEHVDGHAPGVLGKSLQAYAAAGIRSDHEALTVEEGRERLRAGMWLLIREASMARNLEALLPLVAEYGPGRIAFCTDDRDPEDIADNGHVNGMVRDAVAFGIEPADAILMASLHPAQWHRLSRHGAVAPGYVADLLVLGDLERFVPELVLKRGRPIEDRPRAEVPEWVSQTVRVHPVTAADFAIPWDGGAARAIGLVEDQVVTESLELEPLVVDGHAVSTSRVTS